MVPILFQLLALSSVEEHEKALSLQRYYQEVISMIENLVCANFFSVFISHFRFFNLTFLDSLVPFQLHFTLN